MVYAIVKIIVRPLFYFVYFIKVHGAKHAPKVGPYVIVSNHKSLLDPCFMHLAVRPKVHLMAKKELFKNPLLRWLISALGAFPVDRGAGDINSIKTAFKVVRDGKVLGIFPEGTRAKTDELLPFLPGAAAIAMRVNVPILPMYCGHNYKPFRVNHVYVGEPFNLKDELDLTIPHSQLSSVVGEILAKKIQGCKENPAK